MATLTELLEKLNTEEAAISTIDLATELKSSRQTTLKQLTRLRDKGHVDGNSEEGWVITDDGKKALAEGPIHPSMIDEGVTPRQQFEAIGHRIGIKEDRIVLATDIVWSGDYTDVKWVWEALGQADIADDLRKVWVNAWRAKLQKGIPAELEAELTGVPSPGTAAAETAEAMRTKAPLRDYIIVEDQPVRVGPNLGDYSLQDAKDVLAIRALRSRFAGAGGPGTTSPPGGGEKLSELLTALQPYISKGADIDTLKEILADKLEIQKQDILSKIPQGQPGQPKSGIEQLVDFVGALGSLKEAGPTLRSILGIPEPSGGGNPPSTLPVQVTGPDGKPIIMDLGQVIDWRRFQSEERRVDERHGALIGLAQTVRENIPDGIQAILKTVAEVKGGAGAKTPTPEQQPQVFECGTCHTTFSPPPGWTDQPLKCPKCEREYTKEELLG